jgi:predicted permease
MITFNVALPEKRFDTAQKRADWYTQTLQKLSAIPGVTQAEVSTALPYTDDAWVQDFAIENRPVTPGKLQAAERLTVSPGYFGQFHISIPSGRGFAQGDSVGSLPVAVVSRKFADRYFAGENPIGHRIRMGDRNSTEPWLTIVGVAEEVQYAMWDTTTPQAEVYLNAMQMPSRSVNYAVTTAGDARGAAAQVRKAMTAVDATIPVDMVMTFEQNLRERLTGLRYAAVMLGIDALIALLLAAIGVFGVMANMVGERTREIGLRLAMGASREDVLRMVLNRAGRLMGVGLGCGLVLAFVLAQLVASLLRGVRPHDPLVFSGITAATALIALAASWVPARRAAKVEPMVALRDE